MEITKQYETVQEQQRLNNKISTFCGQFGIGTLLNKSGIRKQRGASPLSLFTAIFALPFYGVNFSKGIVQNDALDFRKDAAYSFLGNPRHNWRRFLLDLAMRMIAFFNVLTDEKRERVLIFDDSTYDRSRSKVVELLAWIHDHTTHRNLKGFKLLTPGWSDGVNFLPVDFVLCSSAKETKRVQGITKVLDKRTCGYKRRREAMIKSTDHLESMVKRALRKGMRADYILMDSWFCFPAILEKPGRHVPVKREVQLRDYDGLIGHITITMCRYIFLAYEQRCHDDPRTLGTLFQACSDELRDLSLIEALNRILSLAIDKIRATGIATEAVVHAILETVMATALDLLKKSQKIFQLKPVIATG